MYEHSQPECLSCSPQRRTCSSLRGPLRPHISTPVSMVPKMVSAVEDPARGLFTSALQSTLSLNLPPISLHRVRTRVFLLCFVSKTQTPTSSGGSEAGPVERLIFCSLACFCNMFSQVAVRSRLHSFIGSTYVKVRLYITAGINEGNGNMRVSSACTARLVNNELAVA